MAVLSGLEPKKVFEYFEEISAIPRGSGHTEQIARHCVEFAESRGLKAISDDTDNVLIFKPASPGRENEEPVIIQGHLDMVWEKTSDSDFDFLNSGLRLGVDGDFIFANNTTLGGDDGVAVAMAMALLDDDTLSHPPIEVVFTSDEETGMDGAEALDVSLLHGKRLINLDSEAENILWVSCAGGARADIVLPCEREKNNLPSYEIIITGLHGGHSGAEIHKGYANASMLMGRLLKKLESDAMIYISSINGGTMDNVITRECICTLCAGACIDKTVSDFAAEIKAEYGLIDPEIEIKINSAECVERFTLSSGEKIVSLLTSFPYGVMKMSSEIEGLVQTSLNLGITKSDENKVSFGFSVRSSVNEEKEKLLEVLTAIAHNCGAEISIWGEYPAWEYKKESALREKMIEVYRDLYGKELNVTAIHAGLECGLFADKIKGLDCVSLGPDMYDIHTPQERLSISSTARVYNYLIKVLEVI